MKQYTAEEAAKLARRPARAIRQMIRLGHLRADRYGREYVIAAEDLAASRRRRLLARATPSASALQPTP